MVAIILYFEVYVSISGNQANPRESADLKLVNELLTKAQKTRVRTSAKDKVVLVCFFFFSLLHFQPC